MNGLSSGDQLVYIGTYAAAEAQGIYACAFHTETGQLRVVEGQSGITNPSFLAVNRQGRKIYAVSETDVYKGEPGGSVAVYDFQAETGKITFRRQLPTHGGWPCWVSVGEAGSALFAANYKDGKITVYPLDESGLVREDAVQIISHKGSGPNAARQEGPHAHSIVQLPGSPYVIACDLGIDKLVVYRLDHDSGHLFAHSETKLQPGTGPRHPAFSADALFVYVTGELDCSVTVCLIDKESGLLEPIQTVSVLPAGYEGQNTTADIHLSPDGKFLYVSNRGHDSIAMFAVDVASGGLTPIGHCPTGGKTPRNFAISPDGKFLLVANQDSDSIEILSRDASSGALRPSGHTLQLGKPVCILFA